MKSINRRVPSTLTLPDAVLGGIIQPSVIAQMAVGSKGRIRANPSSGRVFECCVLDVDISDNTVRLSLTDGSDIVPGTPITLAFTARSGLYVGSGPLNEISPVSAGDEMEMVVTLNRLNHVEEREYIRVRIPGAMASCSSDNREPFTCRIVDMSAKGSKLEGEQELTPGTDLELEMDIPPFPRFRVRGKVVWQALFRPGVFRTGVQFTATTPTLRSRLTRLCTFYAALTSSS